MKTKPNFYRITLCALALSLAVTPVQAVDRFIDSGIDIWTTRADGTTFFDFGQEVVPADFFCTGSKPFAGKVAFKGVPIATFPQRALGGADTIVQRLDEAVFDENGVAITRLQIRALQFEAIEPFRNECGEFEVRVGLVGEQPITEMHVLRESPNGGRFEAEVAVHAKIVFTPVGHAGEVLELTREVRFPPRRNSYWAHKVDRALQVEGFVVIDTDFDGHPDTFVPGTSRNFAAGWRPEVRNEDTFRRVQDPSQIESAGALLDGIDADRELARTGLANQVGAEEVCAEQCHCDPGCGNHCLVPPCYDEFGNQIFCVEEL